jgi:phage baseplate assembly protein W
MATYKGIVFYHDSDQHARHINGEDKSLIEAGIKQILETVPGERVMLPEFGSRLPYLIFEPLDDVLKNQIQRETAEAILAWEDRVVITDVDVEEDDDNEHQMNLTIRFRFKEDIQNVHEMTLTLGT